MAERSHLNPSRSNGPDILEIAREKLTLWGVTPAQMDDILTNNRADFKLPLLSPISGIVVRKNVVEGQYVNEGDPIFEVADLRHVWVTAQIFEDQISRVYVGQKVHASVNAIPGKTFEGIVAFIDPALNPETRTVAVRYDLSNTFGDLKPGMYATVTVKTPVSETPLFREILAQKNQKIHVVAKPSPTVADQKICPVTKKELGSMGPPINVSLTETRKVWICCNSCEEKLKSNPDKFLGIPEPAPTGTVLTIPESSVIDTGTRKIVYIESEPGVFEGREVILGARSGEFYPVLDGLEPGQRIATAGSFLIDAETRLNPGASGTYFGSTKP
jgi:Cu(I)/Ag(I) efflux system membrane fusion protein